MENGSNKVNHVFTFKTNINCSGCVARVSQVLDKAEGICHWQVDTLSKDKVLTVHSEGITENALIQVVQTAGFNIEHIK